MNEYHKLTDGKRSIAITRSDQQPRPTLIVTEIDQEGVATLSSFPLEPLHACWLWNVLGALINEDLEDHLEQ